MSQSFWILNFPLVLESSHQSEKWEQIAFVSLLSTQSAGIVSEINLFKLWAKTKTTGNEEIKSRAVWSVYGFSVITRGNTEPSPTHAPSSIFIHEREIEQIAN